MRGLFRNKPRHLLDASAHVLLFVAFYMLLMNFDLLKVAEGCVSLHFDVRISHAVLERR
jgi:hypothetical protein